MGKSKADKKKSELEYDANKARWEYYEKIYPEFKIDSKKLYTDSKNTRMLGNFNYSKGFKQIGRYAQSNTSIVLSGDCFFNFNEDKIAAFKENIKPSKSTVDELDYCHNQHKSDENCVLMPVTGGMNNVKGETYFKDGSLVISGKWYSQKAYDRPDTLVYLINQFYKTKEKDLSLKEAGLFYECSIFRDSLNTFNFPVYYDFMDSFDNAFEFCRLFFKINKKLFARMVESGGRPIEKEEDLLSYISLAKKYWGHRKKLSDPKQ